MIEPIWTYGTQLWSCTSKTNIEINQRYQNITLRATVAAYRYNLNDIIHRVMVKTSGPGRDYHVCRQTRDNVGPRRLSGNSLSTGQLKTLGVSNTEDLRFLD